MTEIPADEGKLYVCTVLDLFSRRLLGYASSTSPDAELAGRTITMALATRGGQVAGVIFHTDRGWNLHCARVHHAVYRTGYPAIDGSDRVGCRQRGR
jgi:putative transposase